VTPHLTPEAIRRVIAAITAQEAGITLSEAEILDGVAARDVLRASTHLNVSLLNLLPAGGKERVLQDLSAAMARIEQTQPAPQRVADPPWPPPFTGQYQPRAMAEAVGRLTSWLSGAPYQPDWDQSGEHVADAALILALLALSRMPPTEAQGLLREMGDGVAALEANEP